MHAQAQHAIALAAGLALGLTHLHAPANAQQSSVTIDVTGAALTEDPNPFVINWFDLVVTSEDDSLSGSPEFINPATAYTYSIRNVQLGGEGLIGGILGGIENPTLEELAQELQQPDLLTLLSGAVRNRPGALPYNIFDFTVQEEIDLGVPLAIAGSLQVSVLQSGSVEFAIRDIEIPLGGLVLGSLTLLDGEVTVATLDTPLQITEFTLDGDFTPAPDSTGFARIRYYDDPAFAPFLIGTDQDNTQFPDPAIPSGVTEAQSSFDTTDNFGIPGPGGALDTVYKTSPTRALSLPSPLPALPAGAPAELVRSAEDFNRAIGLALWPATQPEFPAPFITSWTMAWDLYIPSESVTIPAPGQPAINTVQLINDTHDNDKRGTVTIRTRPDGQFEAGWRSLENEFQILPGVSADEWFRLVITSTITDGARTVFYVDGQPVGQVSGSIDAADFLYNQAPRDVPAFADGEPIPAADLADWGGFPNPWAVSSGAVGATPVQANTTVGLFASLPGDGESVYLANFAFVDGELNAQEVADLGGPDARGIFFDKTSGAACNAADLDADGDNDVFDALAFISNYDPAMPSPLADLDGDGDNDVFDALDFVSTYDPTLCPAG